MMSGPKLIKSTLAERLGHQERSQAQSSIKTAATLKHLKMIF